MELQQEAEPVRSIDGRTAGYGGAGQAVGQGGGEREERGGGVLGQPGERGVRGGVGRGGGAERRRQPRQGQEEVNRFIGGVL